MNGLIYPALIRKTEDGYHLTIPQFNIQAAGEEQIEVIRKASEALSRKIAEYEDTRVCLPLPADISEEERGAAAIVLIEADMTVYRMRKGSRMIRKSVSIPQWLEAEARRKNINFSLVLRNALMDCMGVNAV